MTTFFYSHNHTAKVILLYLLGLYMYFCHYPILNNFVVKVIKARHVIVNVRRGVGAGL